MNTRVRDIAQNHNPHTVASVVAVAVSPEKQRENTMPTNSLPIAIIGAGPVGLAAAAHLVHKGQTPLVLEAGATIAANIRAWGHVQLFSPWRYCVDSIAADMLSTNGWTIPNEDAYPTGHELIDQYLAPLAALPNIAPHLHLNQHVIAIARQGYDKMKTPGREQAPFVVRTRSADGHETEWLARAVIDASGTYRTPNPLGANGLPALGEAALSDRIFYGIPDVLGEHRERYAGQRVLVVGSGHSAFNALLDLAELAQHAPNTRITWALRRANPEHVYGGGADDLLPERGALGQRLRQLVRDGIIDVQANFAITALHASDAGIVAESAQRRLAPVDQIIATTGFRPDLAPLRELRLNLDSTVESPAALAPQIDPNLHSCGTVPPHGIDELSHPESGFYIVGMKSYGRAPTFLLLTGYEQVRSIVCGLVGDWEGARSVKLVLPATGVCSSDRSAGGDCCGAPIGAGVIQLLDTTPNRTGCC
jgi:thioredoxin reductase